MQANSKLPSKMQTEIQLLTTFSIISLLKLIRYFAMVSASRNCRVFISTSMASSSYNIIQSELVKLWDKIINV